MAGAAIITLSAGVVPQQAEAASGTGAISAVLLAPIVISAVQNLHFGQFTVQGAGTGGFVTVSSAGVRTSTAAPALSLVASAPLHTNAIIDLDGANGIAIDMTIPASTAAPVADTRDGVAIAGGYPIVHTTIPAETMVVGNFILGVTGTGEGTNNDIIGLTLTGGAAPADQFALGATVLVKNTNVAGTYTGTYNISANYQ